MSFKIRRIYFLSCFMFEKDLGNVKCFSKVFAMVSPSFPLICWLFMNMKKSLSVVALSLLSMSSYARDDASFDCLLEKDDSALTLLLISQLDSVEFNDFLISYDWETGKPNAVNITVPSTEFYDESIVDALSEKHRRKLSLEVQKRIQSNDLFREVGKFSFDGVPGYVSIQGMYASDDSLSFRSVVSDKQLQNIQLAVDSGKNKITFFLPEDKISCNPSEHNLIKNGDFEQGVKHWNYNGGIEAAYNVEAYGVENFHNGGIVSEMDADRGSHTEIYQDVTFDGKINKLHLSLWFTSRKNESVTENDGIEIFWDGKVVGRQTGYRRGWKKFETDVDANFGEGQLMIKGLGEENGAGYIVDNISLSPMKIFVK